ncbi:ABC transporter ATP-binding protein [Nitratidesulfovibrio vulgaris]|jgi:branched-chain amino acid transport system ATP-binding protein|uniref:High-affinity branched-chain amino acid ABC transporter, ATP-binding protein n=2 Tax=Nitratidesulfovibrio vulgaris TaxID=881 RepID=Q727W4_NITV2|nr:ABC transporter ATP-binding protein [Nitratidesulfovibrio vulgaris]GEB79656.1 ABC transporter ATP-binding protein [Desulfovibrio desulfuricans]HBW16209.1 ABC transporter ATP-binding protein [Desulfovibrio sp.]AAS97212.1 high-affinity branched-chain amino acid ABC transporter, ATP-binding protein [Nitratidesulfovibrio vulgaris str. Hildenborough]ABM27589.1 amino acid/amide ABC transporter ATP-binding protein 2, HAAT family [Nitratidesulfovibrio vulgaris DP4]ADP87674.1 ABC transporter related
MLLSIDNLKVRYGNIEALHGLTFHVNEGEIVTLIGANGAGKSTTLKSIMRLPPPEAPRVSAGDITYKGQSLLNVEPHDVVRKLRIALVPEGRHIFGNLSVMENLMLATYSRGSDPAIGKDLDRIFDLFPRLAERRDQRSDTLSGGEQQMLAVGRALMTNCELLLLDEPSMGLAPLLMYEMFRTLKQLNREGLTIVVVEQNARLALQVADRGYVLDTGEIVAEGSSEQLASDPEVKKAYLGG